MKEYMTIKEAAEYVHVNPATLRRWESEGKFKPFYTSGGQRRFTQTMLDELLGDPSNTLTNDKKKTGQKLTIGYCRVSSAHQKQDLTRQAEVVQKYCENQARPFKMIKDIGSGLNYQKSGLKELIHLICTEQCDTVVVNYKDRLMRFGYDLFADMCQEHHVEIVIINQSDSLDYYQELTQDIISVITVFSAKLYGKESHQSEKIIKANKDFFAKNPKDQ